MKKEIAERLLLLFKSKFCNVEQEIFDVWMNEIDRYKDNEILSNINKSIADDFPKHELNLGKILQGCNKKTKLVKCECGCEWQIEIRKDKMICHSCKKEIIC